MGVMELDDALLSSSVPEITDDDDPYTDKRYNGGLHCGSCGNFFPNKGSNKFVYVMEQLACKDCARIFRSKVCCGICMKSWQYICARRWVCCHGCQSWIHAECDKKCSSLKDLGDKSYFCPYCRVKCNSDLSGKTKSRDDRKYSSTQKGRKPDRVAVVCFAMEGTYLPNFELISCHCAPCKEQKFLFNEWERHAGGRSKNWKSSIKMKDTLMPFGNWIDQHQPSVGSTYPSKGSSHKLKEQQLFDLSNESYEPVHSRWTTARCAVCRWVEDWDYNKIVICNRCQIAVHQECYGVSGKQDFAAWVCRACETPERKREGCLCPVKGGALKPTNVDNLWVHVTSAWFQPHVAASDELMEPAIGILSLPLRLHWVKHLVLVGDECQLSAMVKSKVCKEVGFGTSLYGRLVMLKFEKFVLQIKQELDELDDLLNVDSAVFSNIRWKVAFSDELRKSFTKLKSSQLRREVLPKLIRLGEGWRTTVQNLDMPGVCHLEKVYKVRDLYLVWSTYVKKTERRKLAVPVGWDIEHDIICYNKYYKVDAQEECDIVDTSYAMENSKVSESFLLMKFYSLPSGVATHLLTAIDGAEINIPFELTDEEQELNEDRVHAMVCSETGSTSVANASADCFQDKMDLDQIVQVFVKLLDFPSISVQIEGNTSVTEMVSKALYKSGVYLPDSYIKVDGRTITPETLIAVSFMNSTFTICPRIRGGVPEIPRELFLRYSCQPLHDYLLGLGDTLFDVVRFSDLPCKSLREDFFVALGRAGRRVYQWLFALIECFHALNICLEHFAVTDIVHVPDLRCFMFLHPPKRDTKNTANYRRNVLDIATILESYFRYSPSKLAASKNRNGIHEMNKHQSKLPNHLDVLVKFIKDMPRQNEHDDGMTAEWRSIFRLDPTGMSCAAKIGLLLSLDLKVRFLSNSERKAFDEALSKSQYRWKSVAMSVPALRDVLNFQFYDPVSGLKKCANYRESSYYSLWLLGRNYLNHTYHLKMSLKAAEAMFSYLFVYLLGHVVRALVRTYKGAAIAGGENELTFQEVLDTE